MMNGNLTSFLASMWEVDYFMIRIERSGMIQKNNAFQPDLK